jgi:XisI protein
MASLEKYRACIQHLLTERAQQGGDQWVEAQTIFDTEHDHDQLLYNGWHDTKRIFGPVLHLDIKDGKIWIQWNGTDDDIAAELGAFGVPKYDIVLGFRAPKMR